MRVSIENQIIELIEGDITEMQTDAIVNTANAQLILGGGVAGAIRRKGGPTIQQECNKIARATQRSAASQSSSGTFVGGAVITSGGDLKARYVIHAVGPRMGEGNEDEKLKNATLNSLKVADENKLTSISFPAISTGVFGFPIQRCAEIMLRTTIDYLTRCPDLRRKTQEPEGQSGIERVVFCLYGKDSFQVFENQLKLVLRSEANFAE